MNEIKKRRRYRYRRLGFTYRLVVELEKHVVLQACGCEPFVVSKKELNRDYYDRFPEKTKRPV